MADIIVRPKSILTKVNEAIDKGDVAGAVALINALPDDAQQIAVLQTLASDLALALTSNLADDLALTRARDLTSALAFDHARILARAFALDHALDRALALDHALERAHDMDRTRQTSQVVMGVLRNLVETPNQVQLAATPIDSGATAPARPDHVYLTFIGIEVLTPEKLGLYVVPYLQAFVDLQRIIDELERNVFIEPRIVAVWQNSPIGVELEGGAQAAKTIQEMVAKVGQDHTRKLNMLHLMEREAQIERIRAEILEMRAKSPKEQARFAADAAKIRAEAAIVQAEAERIRQELATNMTKEAITILDSLASGKSDEEWLRHLPKLLDVMNILYTSPLQLVTN